MPGARHQRNASKILYFLIIKNELTLGFHPSQSFAYIMIKAKSFGEVENLLNNEWYSYSIQLQRYLEAQDKRILQLEQEIKHLTEEISLLKNKPPIHVEKIEYKFDQLKVESLDGTLNIGLNPNDLNNIDEFAINNQPASPNSFSFSWARKSST